MENIYDIRRKESLLKIISSEESVFVVPNSIKKRMVIAVNLYYLDMVEGYLAYLNTVPENIDVYVISSDNVVLSKAKSLATRKIEVLMKENRGRDISALLVAFRKIVQQYDYICFLHDKRAHHPWEEKDVETWNKNLWGNMISSEAYINNVMKLFLENPEVGLIVPPEPFAEYNPVWCADAWGNNYGNVLALAEELQLSCNIIKEKMPITLGSVFWTRTECLQKLFFKEWSYEDFQEEPLPIDGTMSHAIERILGYVAQDAGYKTMTVMSSDYAEWMLLHTQEVMRSLYERVEKDYRIHNFHEVKSLTQQEKQLSVFFKKCKSVYLYGAGKYGRDLIKRIECFGCKPTGFVVSDGKKTEQEVWGYSVFELSELERDASTGIVIAVNYEWQEELIEELQTKGFNNYMLGYI